MHPTNELQSTLKWINSQAIDRPKSPSKIIDRQTVIHRDVKGAYVSGKKLWTRDLLLRLEAALHSPSQHVLLEPYVDHHDDWNHKIPQRYINPIMTVPRFAYAH